MLGRMQKLRSNTYVNKLCYRCGRLLWRATSNAQPSDTIWRFSDSQFAQSSVRGWARTPEPFIDWGCDGFYNPS
jgi:hypothetical protein